jgi:hypothetical protein
MELFHGDDNDAIFDDSFFEALFSRQRKTTFCPPQQWRRKQADMAELMDEVKSDADRHQRKIAYRGENRQSTFDEALRPRAPIPMDQKKPLAGVYQKIRLLNKQNIKNKFFKSLVSAKLERSFSSFFCFAFFIVLHFLLNLLFCHSQFCIV